MLRAEIGNQPKLVESVSQIPFALSVAPKARGRRAKSLAIKMFRLRFATSCPELVEGLNTNGLLILRPLLASAMILMAILATGCAGSPKLAGSSAATSADVFYGTTEPFASEAIYFVVTDRFVNGDPGNDHRDQGGI